MRRTGSAAGTVGVMSLRRIVEMPWRSLLHRAAIACVTAAAGVFVWNDQGDRDQNIVYYKNFWHLPLPHQQLSDIKLPNNLSIRCLNPLTCYQLGYEDPDEGNEILVDVTFTASTAPHYLGRSHLDQPGRYQGHIVLHGERIEVAHGEEFSAGEDMRDEADDDDEPDVDEQPLHVAVEQGHAQPIGQTGLRRGVGVRGCGHGHSVLPPWPGMGGMASAAP